MDNCKKKYIIKNPIPGSNGGGSGVGVPIGSDDVIYNGNLLTEFLDGLQQPPFSTDDINYGGDNLTAIIDQLLYKPLAINAFTATQTQFEIGTVLTSLGFNWTFNKAVESQTITGPRVVSPTLTVDERSKTVVLNNINSNEIITLTADDITDDDLPAIIRTLTLSFVHGIYYGKATQPGTVDSAFILGRTKELKATRQKTFQVTTGVNEYIWFFSPVSYGLPSVKTNGFNGGLDNLGTISFTNSLGHVENYYILRSTNTNLGLTTVEIL